MTNTNSKAQLHGLLLFELYVQIAQHIIYTTGSQMELSLTTVKLVVNFFTTEKAKWFYSYLSDLLKLDILASYISKLTA